MLNQRDCSLPFCFCCIFSRSCQFKCLAYNIELVTLILIHILHTIYLSPIWCVCVCVFIQWMNEWMDCPCSLSHSLICSLSSWSLSIECSLLWFNSVTCSLCGCLPAHYCAHPTKKNSSFTRHNDDGLLDERNSSRKRRRQTKQNNWKRFIIID